MNTDWEEEYDYDYDQEEETDSVKIFSEMRDLET